MTRSGLTLQFVLLSLICLLGQSHPSIFLLPNAAAGFVSIDDLRARSDSRSQDFLKQLEVAAELDLQLAYIDPTTDFPGRDPVHLRHHNVSYDMAVGVRDRMMRSSLLFLYTGDHRYKNLLLNQIEALLDQDRWPHWCDHAHMQSRPYVDIRTCQISKAIALTYDWLYAYLSPHERAKIVEGIDRRAIQPFWEKNAQKPGWYQHRHNWFTNIYSGMGITAMALGGDHPDTERLLDTIVPAMLAFNDVFGPKGEFNEPPGYSGAIRYSVEFAEAYRYYTQGRTNILKEHPYPAACYWMMYHTVPPQRLMAFGDTPIDAHPRGSEVFAAVASASHDRILQWYYLENFSEIKNTEEFLWFNPELKPKSPEGVLPLGKAYTSYGGGLISRTSWDPKQTACVVYGKAGRETNHDDNDVGQLLIDGEGERLIIDCGKPDPIYPSDYFRDSSQYNYYTRSAKGHNIIVINNQEIISEPNETARGQILSTMFDDEVGSSWHIDLTPVYKNTEEVTRQVGHLFPGLVVVLDRVRLKDTSQIDLRWHTCRTPQLRDLGFYFESNRATAISKIIDLDGDPISLSSGQHAFLEPYHMSRQGDPLVQRHEEFVQVQKRGKHAKLLTIFVVTPKMKSPPRWQQNSSGWKITLPRVSYQVSLEPNRIRLSHNLDNDQNIIFKLEN